MRNEKKNVIALFRQNDMPPLNRSYATLPIVAGKKLAHVRDMK